MAKKKAFYFVFQSTRGPTNLNTAVFVRRHQFVLGVRVELHVADVCVSVEGILHKAGPYVLEGGIRGFQDTLGNVGFLKSYGALGFLAISQWVLNVI